MAFLLPVSLIDENIGAKFHISRSFIIIFDKSKILALAGKNIEVNFIYLARLFVSLLPVKS